MPPSSSNPYPISDQKKKFSTPVFRLGLQNPYPSLTWGDYFNCRDFLAPASGFQSLQFRLIENKLGIKKV